MIQTYKFADLDNVRHAFIMHFQQPSWLGVQVTGKEAERLVPMGKVFSGSQPFEKGQIKDFLPRLEGIYSTDGLGYLHPSRVTGYHIGETNQTFGAADGLSPTVDINFKDLWTRYIGTYTYTHKDKDDSHLPNFVVKHNILTGYVLSGDKVPIRYIREDCSGEFIPVGREMLELLVREALNGANLIYGTSHSLKLNEDLFVRNTLRKAKKLAEDAKLAETVKRQDLQDLVNGATNEAQRILSKANERYHANLRARGLAPNDTAFDVSLSNERLANSWEEGKQRYFTLSYEIIWGRGRGGIDPDEFPDSLSGISPSAVKALEKHFENKGFKPEFISANMQAIEHK